MNTFATVMLIAVCVVVGIALLIGGVAAYFYLQAALGNNPFR
jgi:zinc transporter ZupT